MADTVQSLKVSMEEMSKAFQTQMEEFQKNLQGSTAHASPTPAPVSLATDFATFKSFVMKALASLQQQVNLLAMEQDRQEMWSRRKILLFHGVAELKDEDVDAVVVNVISEKIKVPFNSTSISRCHRMGPPSGTVARPIIVKFRDPSVRDKIWFSKVSLKGTGITVTEFLTKARHAVFMAAREHYGINKCWTRDGSIVILEPDGTRRRVTTMDGLDKLRGPTETCTASTAPAGPSRTVRPKRAARK